MRARMPCRAIQFTVCVCHGVILRGTRQIYLILPAKAKEGSVEILHDVEIVWGGKVVVQHVGTRTAIMSMSMSNSDDNLASHMHIHIGHGSTFGFF